MKKSLLLTTALTALSLCGAAQIKVGNGQLSGSVESNNIYYMKDRNENAGLQPEDHFGTNDFIKVDYTLGKFSAGIQAEAYLPVLQGFDEQLHGFGLTTKYIQWTDRNFTVRAGDIFDQFGSGLIFRSYEDRALGFNNSLEGIHGVYRFGNYVAVKGMYGRPRLYMEYAGSWVRGADLSISLADITGWNDGQLSLEGSYVNRYEALNKDEFTPFEDFLKSPNLNMYSARLNFDFMGITARAEYAVKGDDYTGGEMKAHKGNAILAELGYNYKRLGILASFRRLEQMHTLSSIYGEGLGNVLNYIPALTRQYTYLLTNLNPYQVNDNGEIGGQFDLYYTLRNRYTKSKYWNFHVNYSTYYTLDSHTNPNTLLWSDINVDIERQWNKKLKTTLLYSRQEWNHEKGYSEDTYVSNIFVGDVTIKFDRKMSLRVEAQYLYSEDYEKDWVAALVEFNVAPQWSFYVSDMYNLGNDNENAIKNFYNVGVSYTKSRSRFQLSYGRNREGFVCSGGVCRYMPGYQGVNFVFTTSF